MREEIGKFGKVESYCQSVYQFEFCITTGFSGNFEDTLKLMDLCKKEAEGYTFVKKMVTKENFFHLILKK